MEKLLKLFSARGVHQAISKTSDMPTWRLVPIAGVRNWKPPPKVKDIEFPDQRKLREMPKLPKIHQDHGKGAKHQTKNLQDWRGPELVQNTLIYKQYGIQAMQSGSLVHGHFEMIRSTVNRNLDDARMFAVWRVPAVWRPQTKKGKGIRMGGGKGPLSHYITPVKEGRMIIELGGYFEYYEVKDMLRIVAHNLPFKARVVNQEMLDEEEEKRQYEEKYNLNPFDFDFCYKHNINGFRKYCSKYDKIFKGKYR